MAYDSWGKVYNNIKRQLMSERNRITYFVLESMATFCDEMGITWVSDERVSDEVGYAVESVQTAMLDLVKRDWARVHVRYNDLKRRNEIFWQLSPAIYYIREELNEQAWKLFYAGEKSAALTSIFTKESEPESLTRARTKPGPKPGTRARTTTTTKEPAKAAKADTSPLGERREQNNHQDEKPDTSAKRTKTSARQAHQTPARSARTTTPPNSAPPPPSDFAGFDEPLPDPDAEKLAWWIKLLGTTIRQARSIVHQHGHQVAGDAYRAVEFKLANGEHVANPVGLMCSLINRAAVRPGEKPGYDGELETEGGALR